MTGGLAHVCLVTSHMTVTRARIEMNIPRKRAGSSDHQKAISRFYEAVYQVLVLLLPSTASKTLQHDTATRHDRIASGHGHPSFYDTDLQGP